MTTVGSRAPDAGAARGTCFGDVDLAQRQLRAINAFHEARRMAEAAHGAVERTREMRMDAARRLEVSRRQHAALVERTQAQLVASGGRPMGAGARRRVVLAHRNAWFTGKVRGALAEAGLEVVAHSDNGADAVGASVAEQPDLLLVEDVLVMLPGADVVRQVRELCPELWVVAQVEGSDRVAAMLDAGADTVLTRQVPPADVAAAMRELVSG